MTDELIRQLRESGHDDAADTVRDAAIAEQLRAADRDDLAESLEKGKAEPAAPVDPVKAEAEAFLAQLRDANTAQWTSAGNLIGS